MAINNKFSTAIHILSFIHMDENHISCSQKIGKATGTNPVIIRRIIKQLQLANLVDTKRGKGGTYLIKDIHDISLLEIYKAVNEQPELFSLHLSDTAECPIANAVEQTIHDVTYSAQIALENELASKTLADVIEEIQTTIEQIECK